MRKIFTIDFMPLWAGAALLIGLTYLLNAFILPMIPYLSLLPELGLVPYGTTGTGILGVWFSMQDEDDRAESAAHICVLFGLLATVMGFAEYLMAFETNATDYGGLKLAFVGTAHGITMALVIANLLQWESRKDPAHSPPNNP